jgi:hypothetical protein
MATALKKYQRLEATGLWRPAPGEQRREVIVSLGSSSLTLSDTAGRALAHWSLAAIRRLDRGGPQALFGPGGDAPDTLEIDDDQMIAALERVRRAVARTRPRPGRLRRVVLGAFLAVISLGAVFWLPDAMIARAVAALPDARRAEFGERMLAALARVGGPPCRTAEGLRALDAVQRRLRAGRPGRIVILPGGVLQSASLPGGIMVLDRSVVEDHDDPAVLAGFVLAEDVRRDMRDPLQWLLEDLGAFAALRLMVTGDLSTADLAHHAETVARAAPLPVAPEALLAGFAAAGVPATPYALALDITGESTLALIEADPVAPADARSVLSDFQWVALQGICGG